MHTNKESVNDKAIIDKFIVSLKNYKNRPNFIPLLIENFSMNQIRKSLFNRQLEDLGKIFEQVAASARYSLINFLFSKKATRELMHYGTISQYYHEPFSQLFLNQFLDASSPALSNLQNGMNLLNPGQRPNFESRIKTHGNELLMTLVPESTDTAKRRGRPVKQAQQPAEAVSENEKSVTKKSLPRQTRQKHRPAKILNDSIIPFSVKSSPRKWVNTLDGESFFYIPFSGFDAPTHPKPAVFEECNPQEHFIPPLTESVEISRPVKRQKMEREEENNLWDDLSSEHPLEIQEDFLTRLDKSLEKPDMKSPGAFGLFGQSIAWDRNSEFDLAIEEDIEVKLEK